jgi:hypothetical protein
MWQTNVSALALRQTYVSARIVPTAQTNVSARPMWQTNVPARMGMTVRGRWRRASVA